MSNYKLIVHCGRGKRDWLKVTHESGMTYFNGFGLKKNATRFISIDQARGAIHMHCVQHRIKERHSKHKIFKVEVKK